MLFPTKTALLSIISTIALLERVSASSLPLTRRATFKTGEQCPQDKFDKLKQALTDCVPIAKQAADFAMTGDGKYMRSYFGKDDQESRKAVSDHYTLWANDCASAAATMASNTKRTATIANGASNTVFHCQGSASSCPAGREALTTRGGTYAYVTLCQLFYDQPDPVPKLCDKYSRQNTLLHELSHATLGTTDGVPAGGDHTKEAYAYGWFAHSVNLKCLDGGPNGPGLGIIPGAK